MIHTVNSAAQDAEALPRGPSDGFVIEPGLLQLNAAMRSVHSESLTLGQIQADRQLGLKWLAGRSQAGSGIRSAHSIDLEYPGRYVLPGELVLTNGLWLETVDSDDWVSEVATAGAVAIGFGITAAHPEVPEAFVAACEAAGLPLLEVHEATSFASLSEQVHLRRPGGTQTVLRRQLQMTRNVAESLAGGEGLAGLAHILHQYTGLPASFLGPGGRVIASAGLAVPPQVAEETIRDALRGGLPKPVGEDWTAFSVPADSTRSVLVIGSPMRLIDDEVRLLIEQVAAYAVVEDSLLFATEKVRRALARELVTFLRAGELTESIFADRLSALGFTAAEATQVISAAVPIELLTHAVAAVGTPHVLIPWDDDWLILSQVVPATRRELTAELAAIGEDDPVLGFGCVGVGQLSLRRSLTEALMGLTTAKQRPTGHRVVSSTEIGSHSLLLEMIDGDAATAYGRHVLGPVLDWDKAHKSQLVSTLRAFFDCGGSWTDAAEVLYIHANTLRYRLNRIEALTGRSMNSTADRVDLFLALAIEQVKDVG